MFVSVYDSVSAEATAVRLFRAVTPVLDWTVDSAVPSVLYFASTTAPVSVLLVPVVAVLSVDPFHLPVSTQHFGLSRVLSVDALLVVDADPAELDLAEVVASVAIANIAVITDLVQLGLKCSVPAVRSHHFRRAHRRNP